MRRVWLQRPGRDVEGPFLVVDCAQRNHRAALIERGWVVDVDWETAQRWGMRGPQRGVKIMFEPDDPQTVSDSYQLETGDMR